MTGAALPRALEAPGPRIVLLSGRPGAGITTTLRRTLAGLSEETVRVAHHCRPVPDADQRAAFPDLGEDPGTDVDGGTGPLDWPDLLARAIEPARRDRRPTVVALDDAHHLLSARHRVGTFLEAFHADLRSQALPVHLVLAGPAPHLTDALDRHAPALLIHDPIRVDVAPMGPREVATLLPDWTLRDRLLAWAIFGGRPGHAYRIDGSVSLATNVRRLILSPDAPLLRAGLEALGEEVQSLPRYVSILTALARGARTWGDVRRGCPDFETGSQIAPYMARLEALGLVDVRRSLDAVPGGRGRRYELTDPWVTFWFGQVLPLVGRIELGTEGDPWRDGIVPRLDAHLDRVVPRACRRWLARHGDERLPSRARVVGGLWGSGYDLPTAGTLMNGAAFYGLCAPSGAPADAPSFDTIHRSLRETRWGFGREGRHRIVFAVDGFTGEAARAAARDVQIHAIGLEDLLQEPVGV